VSKFRETAEYRALPKRDKLALRAKGNLANASNPLKVYLKRRVLLRPEDQTCVRIGQRLAQSLIDDRGGEGNVTAAEQALVENVALSRTVALMCLREISERGAFLDTPDGRVASSAMKLLATYLGSERQALTVLGLDRKTKDVINLNEYLAARQ
jgi:hypothetical protein